MGRAVLISCACLAMVFAPGSAQATRLGWQADGILVAPGGHQSHPVVIADGSGGVYVAWVEWGIRVQRLTANGTVASGWPGLGIRVFDGTDPVLCGDGRGGAFVAAHDGPSTGHAHLDPDGVVTGGESAFRDSPRVDSSGAKLSDARKYPEPRFPLLVLADSGRVYLTREVEDGGTVWMRIGRLAADGSRDLTWSWNKWVDDRWCWKAGSDACSDGAAGLLFAWERPEIGGGFATMAARVSNRGVMAPDWGSERPVCLATGRHQAAGIASDGTGGALVAWLDTRNGVSQVFAQRLVAGVPAPGWPVDGLMVSSRPSQGGPARFDEGIERPSTSVAPDGSGGFYIVWSVEGTDLGDIACQRLTQHGQPAPGWPADGLILCSAPRTQDRPSIVADGSGGAIVTWRDGRVAGTADLYATRVLDDGTLASGWPQNGLRICGHPGSEEPPRLVAVDDGAVIVWEDDRCGAGKIFATHVGIDGSLPTLPADTTLAVSFAEGQFAAGRATLFWDVRGSDDVPHVQRRAGADWTDVGPAEFDALGRAFISDSAPFAGCVYSYRLGMRSCRDSARIWVGEASVSVPTDRGFREVSAVLRPEPAGTAAPRVRGLLSPGPIDNVTIERSVENEPWISIGTLTADSERAVVHQDDHTVPGTRYGYRLRLISCGHDYVSNEVWLLTGPTPPAPDPPPGSPALLELSLGLLSPNPVAGAIWVRFSLPTRSPALLELFDSQGRQRDVRRFGGDGPGSYIERVGESQPLAPGVYWLRLRQDSKVRIARFTLLK